MKKISKLFALTVAAGFFLVACTEPATLEEEDPTVEEADPGETGEEPAEEPVDEVEDSAEDEA